MSALRPGIVARWTTRCRPAGAPCSECGTLIHEATCPECGQLAGDDVAMQATVVDTAAGARLVIAEHTARGWVAVRTVPATAANVAALSRPGATGRKDTAPVGGLW